MRRNWLNIAAILYAALVLASNLWLAESTPVTMLFAFAPTGLALIPLLISGIIMLIRKRARAVVLHFGLIVLLLLVASGFSYGRRPNVSSDLSIATYNIHLPRTKQAQDAIVAGLLAADADVLCLQETAWNWEVQLPGYHMHRVNQMTIASRYPIISKSAIQVPYSTASRPLLLATIDVRGKPVTIATVHLRALDLSGIGALFVDLQKSGPEKVVEARFIAEQLQSLKTPFILCGDFNATPMSNVLRTFRSIAKDAYASTSFGFGFTSPLRRIDYVMLGDGLQPVSARVFPKASSDHCLLRTEVALH